MWMMERWDLRVVVDVVVGVVGVVDVVLVVASRGRC